MTYILYNNGVVENDGVFTAPNDEDYQAWLALGNTPELRSSSEYFARKTSELADMQQVKTEYVNMINRLEQIQAAVSPTNAQVVQAIKDEALYIERIMKVIRRLVT